MPAIVTLIRLLGEVALLFWGVDMAKTGMQRALGSDLRWILGIGLKTRLRAFASGAAVGFLLPSSTATVLMLTSSATGVIDLVPALAAMLGTNVGATLAVQIVSLDISSTFPILIFCGFIASRKGTSSRMRDLGQAAIGLGLIFLSLTLLAGTLQLSGVPMILKDTLASSDRALLVALSGVLGWAVRSSVAAMLLIMSLATAGVLTSGSILAIVLGAHIGAALHSLIEGKSRSSVRLRVSAGNLVFNLVGCALALPFIDPIALILTGLWSQPARIAANFHTLFNILVAIILIQLLSWLAVLLLKVFPDRPRAPAPDVPQHLAVDDLNIPSMALSNATQEAIRLADVVRSMLRTSQSLFHEGDLTCVMSVRKMDNVVDSLYGAIYRYLGAIEPEALSEEQAQRLSDIFVFVINLEHIGDIIDKNLMELAAKRIKHHLCLSEEELENIAEMHQMLLEHLDLAVSVLMVQDVSSARRLVAEKDQFREIERTFSGRHLGELRSGQVPNNVGAFQLDVVRDLKRVDAHLSALARSLLERSGDLHPSRLA